MSQKQSMNKLQGVPEPTVRRLPSYLHYLKILKEEGRPYVSAPHIANDIKSDPTQVVKDLSYTGVVGKTRIGYDVEELIIYLENFLGFNRQNEAFLVGAGNLGSALIGYQGFQDYGVKIIAAFDTDKNKIGNQINGIHVLHVDKFRDLAQRLHIFVGIITTPAEAAQSIADLMVGWGIKAIWNFAPVHVKVPEDIIIENTSLYASLAVLLNKIKEKEEKKEEEK